MPVVGWLFSETHRLPGRARCAWRRDGCVFAPNPVPDRLSRRAPRSRWCCGRRLPRQRHRRRGPLPLRAGAMRRATARSRRRPWSSRATPTRSSTRRSIRVGLARDIPGAELVWVRISATSRTGSRPTWSSRRSRNWRASRATCRRWRKASKRGLPATLRRDKCADRCADEKQRRLPSRRSASVQRGSVPTSAQRLPCPSEPI